MAQYICGCYQPLELWRKAIRPDVEVYTIIAHMVGTSRYITEFKLGAEI